jgi:hypothetical protein
VGDVNAWVSGPTDTAGDPGGGDVDGDADADGAGDPGPPTPAGWPVPGLRKASPPTTTATIATAATAYRVVPFLFGPVHDNPSGGLDWWVVRVETAIALRVVSGSRAGPSPSQAARMTWDHG